MAEETTAPKADLNVGDLIRVNWSNGHGYSIYEIIDDPNAGPHHISLVGEYEMGEAVPQFMRQPG
jgi:hypothetical protein